MTKTSTQSNSTTEQSEMEKHKSARYALLAMVGRRKKEVLALQEEADHWSLCATEALVDSLAVLTALEKLEDRHPEVKALVAEYTSRHTKLLKQCLNYYPQTSESQSRISDLLDSDGLATALDATTDGYVSLSMDRMLRNVERVIALTKVPNPRTSSTSSQRMPSPARGTGGDDRVRVW